MEIFHNLMLILFVGFMFFLIRGFIIQQEEKHKAKEIERERKIDAIKNGDTINSSK